MRPILSHTALFASALLFAAGTAMAAEPAEEPAASQRSCFLPQDWDGWTAPGNGDALLLKVRNNDVYRVELTPGSRVRKGADNFLISRARGSSWICKAIDLDLALADPHGFSQPLIAVSLRKLTPEEVAAIPKRDRP